MKKFFLAAILIYLITVPTFAKNTILILGDSLSAGYGLKDSESWVIGLEKRLTEKKPDYQVINISISGNTTSNGIAQLPPALQKYHPYLTIIELGGNDGLRGLPLGIIKHNLQKLISMAKDANSKVLLVGLRLPPNYGKDYIDQFASIFVDLAKENQIELVPLFLKGVDDHPELMSPDRIHPTASAQSYLLNNIWETLEPML